MKKNVRKKLLGFVLAAFLAVSAVTALVSFTEIKNADVVYAIENVDEIPETSSTEYFSKYAVGETFCINGYKVSVNGEMKSTYAVLQKDLKAYASLSPEEDALVYKFTEAGEYNLIYFYVTETQSRVVVKNITFTVSADQAYFDVVFQKEYMLNSVISVATSCIKGSTSVTADLKVTSPFGDQVALSNGTLTLSQNGVYRIVYSAVIGGETFEKTYYVRASSTAQSYKDYFTSVSGTLNAVDDMQAPAYAKAGSGVGLTTDVISTVRFNNIIDLREMTQEQDLIKLLPLCEGDYGIISIFKIQLIDVYDSNNMIEWVFKRYAKGESAWMGGYTYCNISYNGRLYALHPTQGLMIDSSTYGVGTRICCNATYLKTNAGGMYYGYAPWARCQINYADRKFFAHVNNSTGALSYAIPEQKEIIDLDEASYVGYGNEWQGFTTGEVYLQIDIQATGTQSGCIVQEIAGQKLYGEVKDTGAPNLYFDVEENGALPKGLKDEFYPFPVPTYSNDIMEGTKAYPKYTVAKLEYELLQDRAYSEMTISSQEGFTPNIAGRYRITYQTTDESGNIGEKQTFFTIEEDFGNVEVVYSLNSDLYVGNTIIIPKISVEGLSHLVKKAESITYDGKEYAAQAGESLFLNKAGQILIKCAYEDYLGNTYELEEGYEVVALDKAITVLQGCVPKYALKGRTIILPDYSAINYSKNKNVTWSLTVDGVAIDTKTREVTINGDHDQKLDVVYTADGIEECYQITVIDAKYLSDRFYATTGSVAITNESNNVVANVQTNAEIEYIFPFILDKSNFNFGFDIEGAFESIDVYFEDYLDAEQKIFLRLKKTAVGVTAQINGEGQEFAISAATKHEGYLFQYDHHAHTFQFENLVAVKNTLAGKAFEGITSDRVNMRFVFNGVTSATAMRFYQIGTLTFLSTFDANNNLVAYTDAMFPILVGERSYLENDFTYGGTAIIPAMEARTPLSGGCKNTLTVTSPSGKVILNSVNGYNDYEIELTEYGVYEIVYTAPFRATTKKYKYSFRVFKEDPPVIELKTPLKETYAYGETISLPEVTVTNASNGYTVEYFVSTPNGTMTALTDGVPITLNSYGTYVLSVFVTDEHNVTFKKWTFKVEG